MSDDRKKLLRRMWDLDKEVELRLEVSSDEVVEVVLKEGTAEIFGVELSPNREYSFNDTKLAIFTFYGCRLEVVGKPTVAYVQGDTPMLSYVNTHSQLEARRDVALAHLKANPTSRGVTGPRVIIVGPTDCGKSTLAATLTSYAVRLSRSPTYVDLDVGQGQITVPGTISAAAVDSSTLSIEEGFSLAAPLSFYYGHTQLAENPEVYKRLVTRLAECVDHRLANDTAASAAGVIINTCGWIDGLGGQLLHHCIRALSVDIILVLGHDRLYSEMSQLASDMSTRGRDVRVVRLDRSAGVVLRDARFRRAARTSRIREYFYGSAHPKTSQHKGMPPPLSPSMLELNFDDVKIYQFGGPQGLADTMLPVGQASMFGAMTVTRISPGLGLLNSLLSVCHPPLRSDGSVMGQERQEDDEDDEELSRALLHSNAAGFVYVSDINVERRRITCLSPCPGALPSNYLLVGSIKWME